MNWITSLLGNLNYGTIWLLMLLESTVIPVPSELVVSPLPIMPLVEISIFGW